MTPPAPLPRILTALLPLLIAAPPCLGQPTVRISTKITEMVDGEPVVTSAPRLVVLAGQKGAIRIGEEIKVAPTADKLRGHGQVLEEGLNLAVTPSVVDDRVLLQGTLRVARRQADAFHRRAESATGGLLVHETTFVVWTTPDEPRTVITNGPFRIDIEAELTQRENAALGYWQAFAALPPEPEGADAAARAAWAEQAEPALDLLRKAAAVPHCDWDLDLDQGPELLLPHLAKMRTLVRAAVARATARRGSDPTGADADLRAAFLAARHVGTDPVVISQLVRATLEGRVFAALEPTLEAMPAERRASWRALLDGLPPTPTLAQLVDAEERGMLGYLQALVDGGDDAKIRKLFGEVPFGPEVADIQAMLDATAEDYCDLRRIADKADPERVAKLAAFEKRLEAAKAERPLSAMILPHLSRAAEKLEQAEDRVEGLRARLARP